MEKPKLSAAVEEQGQRSEQPYIYVLESEVGGKVSQDMIRGGIEAVLPGLDIGGLQWIGSHAHSAWCTTLPSDKHVELITSKGMNIDGKKVNVYAGNMSTANPSAGKGGEEGKQDLCHTGFCHRVV